VDLGGSPSRACTHPQGVWSRRISKNDWRGIERILQQRMDGGEAREEEPDPYRSSTHCSRCGWHNKDLNGAEVYERAGCGLRIDRQPNTTVNPYTRLRFGTGWTGIRAENVAG